MRPHRPLISLTVALFAGAGGGCAPEPPYEHEADARLGRAGAPIVGGKVELGRPAVVALISPGWEGDLLVCSGVLVTEDIVVTAAHCIHPHVTGMQADELIVSFGRDIVHKPVRIAVAAGAYHPQYRPDDPDKRHDIGAVRLSLPAPVDPIPIGPGPAEGEEVLIVGFGTLAGSGSGSELSGSKRSGTAIVSEIGDSWFRIDRAPATTCAGDSGGATLSQRSGTDILIGIHSRGDCETAVWNERIDIHASGFLQDFMATHGGCLADGACAVGCPGPDPDCPCAADESCNADCGSDPDCEAPIAGDCPEGDCAEARAPSPGGSWGGAGCAMSASVSSAGLRPARELSPPGVPQAMAASRSAWGLLVGLVSLLAFRRRGGRGGSSRSGS